ncbi:MAG: hypothetical protein EZS28_052156, partial [Streblomastix strix]
HSNNGSASGGRIDNAENLGKRPRQYSPSPIIQQIPSPQSPSQHFKLSPHLNDEQGIQAQRRKAPIIVGKTNTSNNPPSNVSVMRPHQIPVSEQKQQNNIPNALNKELKRESNLQQKKNEQQQADNNISNQITSKSPDSQSQNQIEDVLNSSVDLDQSESFTQIDEPNNQNKKPNATAFFISFEDDPDAVNKPKPKPKPKLQPKPKSQPKPKQTVIPKKQEKISQIQPTKKENESHVTYFDDFDQFDANATPEQAAELMKRKREIQREKE